MDERAPNLLRAALMTPAPERSASQIHAQGYFRWATQTMSAPGVGRPHPRRTHFWHGGPGTGRINAKLFAEGKPGPTGRLA